MNTEDLVRLLAKRRIPSASPVSAVALSRTSFASGQASHRPAARAACEPGSREGSFVNEPPAGAIFFLKEGDLYG